MNTTADEINALLYFLIVEGEKMEVCKKLFPSTLAVGEFTVLSWVKKNGDTAIPPSKKRRNTIRKRG